MDGVAHLMGQGKLAVQGAVVIEQHIGVDMGAGRIRAGPLAGVFIDVDPPVVKALPQNLAVFLAHGRQGFIDRLPGLFIGDLPADTLHQRRIDIIHVQFVHTQQLLAQTDVAVHLVHIAVDRIDQVVIHGHRHPSPIERSLQGRAIVTGVCIELQLLHLARQHGSHSVAELTEGSIQVLEGRLPQRPVTALHILAVGALSQRIGLPFPVHSIFKGQISVAEHGKCRIGRLGHLAGTGQQLFFCRRKNMGPTAAEVLKIPAVQLQSRFVTIELFQHCILNGQHFRRLKAGRRGGLHPDGENAVRHGLIGRHTGILIGAALGILRQIAEHPVHTVLQLQIVAERPGRLPQLSGVLRYLCQFFAQLFQSLLPLLVAGKQILNGPKFFGLALCALQHLCFHVVFLLRHKIFSALLYHVLHRFTTDSIDISLQLCYG